MSKEYIANGAICICKHGTAPAVLKVKKKTKTINGGKMIASNMELGDVFNPPACIICKVNPLYPKVCKANITKWSNPAKNEKLQGGAQPLLPASKATCAVGTPDCVSIKFHGQIELLGAPQMKAATNEFLNELNPLAPIFSTIPPPSSFQLSILKVKAIETYAIESIKIVSELDFGSKNDGKTEDDKKGMIYGKTYELEIEKFKDDKEPHKDVKIYWQYSYVEEDENGDIYPVIGGFQNTNKRKVSFKIDDVALLGKEVTFYAFITDKTLEAKLDVWVHYRYRYIDRKCVVDELATRKTNAWKVNQGSTPLCGMAAIFYLFAKNQPEDYEKIILNLHRTGKATHNGYTIAPFKGKVRIPGTSFLGIISITPASYVSLDASKVMYNMNPNSSKYPRMPQADWLALATTRSKESTWIPMGTTLVYQGEEEDHDVEQILGVNWPTMLASVCRNLLGYKNVREVDLGSFSIASVKLPTLRKKILRQNSIDSIRKLKKMDELYNMGHDIIMMIDSNMISGINSSDFSDIFNNLHWIVYEGGLKMYDENNIETLNVCEVKYVKFKIFTWGNNIEDLPIFKLSAKRGLSVGAFHSTFFGYINCWNDEYLRNPIMIDSPIPSIDNHKKDNGYGLA